MIKAQARSLRRKAMGAFTLLELMIVVSIMAVIAGLVVESGHRSLERARIDAVAVDMAGWLIAMHANNSSATNFNAATACFVDFTGAGAADATTAITVSFGPDGSSSIYPRGTPVFSIRDGTVNGVFGSGTSCSNPVRSFSLPDSATGAYEIRAFSPIIYSVRGSVAIANNINGVANANDIKIYRADSRLLRCVRIYYSTGTIRIGSNSNADNIDAECIQFNTF